MTLPSRRIVEKGESFQRLFVPYLKWRVMKLLIRSVPAAVTAAILLLLRHWRSRSGTPVIPALRTRKSHRHRLPRWPAPGLAAQVAAPETCSSSSARSRRKLVEHSACRPPMRIRTDSVAGAIKNDTLKLTLSHFERQQGELHRRDRRHCG
jgi:hypothetical protein